jgi:hypothetical protein
MFWKKKKNKSSEFKCSTCGESHDEIPALGFKTPFHYDILNDKEKVEIAEIDDDFCIIKHSDQTDRFIRTTLRMQINDVCEDLDYGIWVSLSEKSFNDYKAGFKANIGGKIYLGTICNEISDYNKSTIGLHVNVNTKSGGIRPEIIPHNAEHKLISDWEKGILIQDAEKRIEKTIKNVG